jgi:ammonia channel protein AmtB
MGADSTKARGTCPGYVGDSVKLVSGIIQLVGLVAITAGVAIALPWAGFIVGGVCLVAVGVALEMSSRAR